MRTPAERPHARSAPTAPCKVGPSWVPDPRTTHAGPRGPARVHDPCPPPGKCSLLAYARRGGPTATAPGLGQACAVCTKKVGAPIPKPHQGTPPGTQGTASALQHCCAAMRLSGALRCRRGTDAEDSASGARSGTAAGAPLRAPRARAAPLACGSPNGLPEDPDTVNPHLACAWRRCCRV